MESFMWAVVGGIVVYILTKFLFPIVSPALARWALTIFGKRRKLSHKDIVEATRDLCTDMYEDRFLPDYILGIDGAGLYIASLIGTRFGKPTIEFAADRTDPNHIRFPKDKEFFEKLKEIIKDKKILLVDDFSYTGETLRNAREALEGIPEDVRIAVISKPSISWLKKMDRFPPIYYNYSATGFEHRGRESIQFPWPV